MTLLSLSLAALVFSSCSRIAEGAIKLPANPILTGGLGWAIVKEAYVRLKESPSDSARDLDHLRRGGVFRLDEREFGAPGVGESAQDSPAIWYGLTSEGAKGWVKDSELDIYSSQAQAEKAAAVYR
jgi:hypothetical protein